MIRKLLYHIEEYLLGETTFGVAAVLAAWPQPYRGGDLRVSFATPGGLGQGAALADVSLYDVTGRLIRTVESGQYEQGYHVTTWDGLDSSGRQVASGIYFLRLRSLGLSESRKVVVIR